MLFSLEISAKGYTFLALILMRRVQNRGHVIAISGQWYPNAHAVLNFLSALTTLLLQLTVHVFFIDMNKEMLAGYSFSRGDMKMHHISEC